jgi:hypothetical protein
VADPLFVTVMLVGQVMDITQLGCTTVTVKLQVLVSLESLAVLVTVVVPTGKVLPEGGEEEIIGVPLHESVAVTEKYTVAGTLEVTVMFVGHSMDITQCGPAAFDTSGDSKSSKNGTKKKFKKRRLVFTGYVLQWLCELRQR